MNIESLPETRSPPITRREFLKLSGLGILGAYLPKFNLFQSQGSGQQGRVIDPSINVYDIPSFSGRQVSVYWQDIILPISGLTIGDDIPEHNRVWYRIGNEGYAHSGSIQPVETILQDPTADIRPGGQLAEITVPYTDAHWGPGKSYEVAYRFYFSTTHWVIGLVEDDDGNPWYQILDDKWEDILFVPATHVRLVPDQELTPLSPDVPSYHKRLEINTYIQTITAYEYENPVFIARIASGAVFSTGDFSTPTGRHMTFHKRPSRHMAAGNLAANGYDLPGVPWVIYFTEEGIAIHGTFWHNDFGRPRSHGCINVAPHVAKWIYRWTNPEVPVHAQSVYKSYGTVLDVI